MTIIIQRDPLNEEEWNNGIFHVFVNGNLCGSFKISELQKEGSVTLESEAE